MDREQSDVGKNAAVTAVASFAVRVSGLAREIVFAAVFGAGMAADAFNAAFRAAQFFRDLVAEGAMASIYIPVFSDVAEKDGLAAAWRLANAFLGALLVLLGGLTLLTFLLAEGWIWLLASGFTAIPGKFELAVDLTRILAPFVALMSLASVFMGMLNVRGRFFLPGIAPAVLNVATIAGCLLAAPLGARLGLEPIAVVAWASLLGGLGQLLVQVPGLRAEGYDFRIRLARHPALGRLVRFTVPALIALMTVQFNLLVESQLASRFGDGPVSYLIYAFRLVQLPVSIVAGSVALAALVNLSALVARGDSGQLPDAVREAFGLNSFLVIPASAGLFLLADPLIRLAFERGAFTPADTAATAAVLQMYALAAWGICTHRVTFPCYYALGDPYYPMKVAIFLAILKVPIALGLVYPLGMGFIGLPLSHGLLVTAECALLWWGLSRRLGGLPGRLWTDHARMLLAVLPMSAAVYALRPWSEGLGVIPVTLAGAIVYFAAAILLGLREPRVVLGRLLRRKKGLPPTVDPGTQDALRALAGSRLGSLALGEGRLSIITSAGAFRVEARAGLLVAERAGEGQGEGEPLSVGAVMKVGQGPPRLHGLKLGDRWFRAAGDAVEEGQAPGPVLPVNGP